MIKSILKTMFKVKNGTGKINGGKLTKIIASKYKKNKEFLKNKKIFVFSKIFFAGNETFIKSLSKIIDKRFYLKFFFYEYYPNFSLASNRFIYLNRVLPSSPTINLNKIMLFIKNFFTTYSLIKKEGPKIIIVIGIYSLIIVCTVTFFLKLKPKVVFLVETNIIAYIMSKPSLVYRTILYSIVNYFISHVRYFIFCSKSLFLGFKSKFKSNGLIKYTIIHHGINLNLTKKLANKKIPERESMLLNPKHIKIISIGRFEEQKDFFTIIKAFKIIRKKISSVNLVLVGDGTLKKELEKICEISGLKNFVHFLGWKQNVFPYLKNSDIFVYSSHYEGFGYVLLEAMSQRLPIIATNTKYTPSEILERGKYGFIVPVNDEKKMAETIIKLVKNDELRKKYAQLAWERVKYFDEKKMIQKYKQFLLNLI